MARLKFEASFVVRGEIRKQLALMEDDKMQWKEVKTMLSSVFVLTGDIGRLEMISQWLKSAV